MKVALYHRSYGIHNLIKETEIKGNFSDYVKKEKHYMDNFIVDEDKLIKFLPNNFLPMKPELILMTVGNNKFSTGLYNIDKFKNWAKYFDCYIVELREDNNE